MSIRTCYIIGCKIQDLPFGTDESSKSFQLFDKLLYQKLLSLYVSGYSRFYTNLNKWADIWSAENVIRLTNYCSDVELNVILKSPQRLNKDNQQRIEHILYNADKVLGTCKNKSIMHRINAEIDAFLILYNAQKADSTFNKFVEEAKKRNKEIFTINLANL